MRPSTLIVLTISALLLTGYISESAPTPVAQSDVTFTRDVAPILYSQCVACTRNGELAPMPVLTHEDPGPWGGAIKEKVVLRQMPPWFADPKYGTFANDPSLTTREIDTISKWVDGGAVKGDVQDLP